MPEGACSGFTFQWLARAAEGPPALPRLNPVLHPVHVRDHRPQQGRGAVSRGDRRTGPRRRCRAPFQQRGPHPLGAPARVPLRGDDRGLHPRRGAHPSCAPTRFPNPPPRDAAARAQRALRLAVSLRAPRESDARVPLSGVRLALSTSAPITAAVMDRFESLYSTRRPGVRPHRGGPALHQYPDRRSVLNLGGPSVPGYEVAVLSERASGFVQARSVRLPCAATVCFPRTTRRGSCARTSIGTAGS